MNNPVLETQGLDIGYKQRSLVRDISVTLGAGELVCLLGPNGAGKSTLLRTLAGMQAALAGCVRLLGDDVFALSSAARARRLSLVLTERIDVGLLSVEALVALGRHPYTDWQGRLTPQDHEVIDWALEAVSARHLVGRNMSELSDGERQKVMIARALAQEPALMILDEPTAFLDLPRRVEIMQMLRQLSRATGRTFLLSTHDLDLALRHADKIWLLPLGGKLQVGAPEDLALGGALETTFKSEGVHFDLQSGAFRPNIQITQSVNLIGQGVAALWTERALERAGFGIAQNGEAAIRVEIFPKGENMVWQIVRNGERQQCSSLESLIAALK